MTQRAWLNDPYLALGAQVRLKRNVDGLPFGPRLQEAQALGLLHRAEDASQRASGAEMVLVPLQDLSPDCRQALVAQGLISRDMEEKNPCGLIWGRDKGLALLVNGEEHLTIQAQGEAPDLNPLLKKAMDLETLLEESLDFSYDEEWGYLTQDPQHIGTGLQASVVLHLPLLTRTGQIKNVAAAVRRVGIKMENTPGRRESYRLVNQTTLGMDEKSIIHKVNEAAQGILSREMAWRQAFRHQHPGVMEDRVWRAMGIARCARRMDWEEGQLAVSQLRLGASQDILPGFSPGELMRLEEEIHPALLTLGAGRALSPQEEAEARARCFRRVLSQKPLED